MLIAWYIATGENVMASVFKRGGKANRQGHYTASWFDEHGKRVNHSTGTADYDVACQIAGKWETDTALRKSGIINSSQARVADHNQTPIAQHVADYIAHCQHVGQDRVHVANKETQLEKLVEKIGISRLSDIEPNKVERYLAGLVKAGKSHRTANQHRATAVAFAEWLFEQGRIASNPLRIVPTLNEATDRRRVRKAMTDDELSRLLGVSDERKPYYLFAYYTGLRVKAVKAAAWGDVDFQSAMIRVKAGNAKGKRDEIYLPLHPALLSELQRIKPTFAPPTARIFRTVPTVRTFHRDCERAKIDRYDAERRQLDRHALRTTLGTHLAQAGVLPQSAMRVLGHSDVRITMKHYTALRIEDTAKAVQTLPSIEASKATDSDVKALRATGTDGKSPENSTAAKLTLTARQQKRQQLCGSNTQNLTTPVADDDTKSPDGEGTSTCISPRKNSGFGNVGQPVTTPDLLVSASGDTMPETRAIGAVG